MLLIKTPVITLNLFCSVNVLSKTTILYTLKKRKACKLYPNKVLIIKPTLPFFFAMKNLQIASSCCLLKSMIHCSSFLTYFFTIWNNF